MADRPDKAQRQALKKQQLAYDPYTGNIVPRKDLLGILQSHRKQDAMMGRGASRLTDAERTQLLVSEVIAAREHYAAEGTSQDERQAWRAEADEAQKRLAAAVGHDEAERLLKAAEKPSALAKYYRQLSDEFYAESIRLPRGSAEQIHARNLSKQYVRMASAAERGEPPPAPVQPNSDEVDEPELEDDGPPAEAIAAVLAGKKKYQLGNQILTLDDEQAQTIRDQLDEQNKAAGAQDPYLTLKELGQTSDEDLRWYAERQQANAQAKSDEIKERNRLAQERWQAEHDERQRQFDESQKLKREFRAEDDKRRAEAEAKREAVDAEAQKQREARQQNAAQRALDAANTRRRVLAVQTGQRLVRVANTTRLSLERVPQPGGIGLLLIAILFILFAIQPVNSAGLTRLQLMWLALMPWEDVKLPTTGTPDLQEGDGGIGIGTGQINTPWGSIDYPEITNVPAAAQSMNTY